MSDEELMAAEFFAPRFEAKKLLQQAKAGGIRLTAEGWKALTIAAGGTEEEGQAALDDYVARQVKAGEPVEGLDE